MTLPSMYLILRRPGPFPCIGTSGNPWVDQIGTHLSCQHLTLFMDLFPSCFSVELSEFICLLLGQLSPLAFRVVTEQGWLLSMIFFFFLGGFFLYWFLSFPIGSVGLCWRKVEMSGY